MSKILIIEDEESLRDVYREMFENEGFTVESAVDGQEGLEKVPSFLPDAILLDIMMPRKSGFDVLKELKSNQLYLDIPVLVVTNIFTNAEDLVKNWGASRVLLKVDYTPGEVVDKVREVLSIK